jgi:hypothetical protein
MNNLRFPIFARVFWEVILNAELRYRSITTEKE